MFWLRHFQALKRSTSHLCLGSAWLEGECWIPVVWYSGWYPSLGLARLSGPASSFLCSVPFFRFCFYIHIINKRWQVYPLIPIAVSTLYTTCFRTSAHFRGYFPPLKWVPLPQCLSLRVYTYSLFTSILYFRINRYSTHSFYTEVISPLWTYYIFVSIDLIVIHYHSICPRQWRISSAPPSRATLGTRAI